MHDGDVLFGHLTYLDGSSGLVDPNVIRILRRLGLALYRDRRDRIVRSLPGQPRKLRLEVILRELYIHPRLEQPSRLYSRAQAADRDVFPRPEVHMHVERISNPCEACVIRTTYLA